MIHYFTGVGCMSLKSSQNLRLAITTEAFLFAFLVAVPASIVSAIVQYVNMSLGGKFLETVLPNDDLYKVLSTIVGFLLVFHTSQAYSRYVSGITLVLQMMGDYVDVISLLVAFARNSSTATRADVETFIKTAASLVSLLFMYSLADLEESGGKEDSREGGKVQSKLAYKYEVLDVQGIDEDTLHYIITSPCKVETICQMLQTLIGDHLRRGILDTPAPLMTRVFQELGNGVLKFHEALKFRHAPFPFTYIAVMDMLMFIHWCATPIFIASWTHGIGSAAFSTLVGTFALFSINGIAGTLENPFGTDLVDLDGEALCKDFNMKLKNILETHTHPPPRNMDGDSLNPSTSIVFSSVLQAFQDHGVIDYVDESEKPGRKDCFPSKVCAYCTRRAGKHPTGHSQAKISQGTPLAEGFGSHVQHNTRLYKDALSIPSNIQQELPPHPGRLCLESPCSRDDALGLQTRLQLAIETRKGVTNPDLGNNIQQAIDEPIQDADDTTLQEGDMGSSHVHVDLQAF